MFPHPSPVLLGQGGPTDPFFSSVVLLLSYDNVPPWPIDESPALRGTASASTSAGSTGNPKFGARCAFFNGTQFITWNDSNDYSFGSGDFTVETWFLHSDTVTDSIIAKWNSGTGQQEWAMFVRSSLIEFYWSTDGTTSSTVNANPGYSTGTYYHIAFSRVGNTGYLCFDGLVKATVSMTGVTIRNGTAKLALGSNNEGTSAFFTGLLDETRITKGVGRYSGIVGASYTLPTTAFPRS